ncbi:hypothetical protein [Macrococcus brunensis]|uniref:hypothetical protein n=1 Tax=Macrococcus brunensis TaxID=198483 RepID=UPI001EF0D3B2|nr:hypothetical protein [Macrococcus brunensis]ULG72994.1 hypothetical protein MGG12_05615 [Macrococcus brunensis]
MKRKEFIAQVEKLGLEVEEVEQVLYVKEDSKNVLAVWTDKVASLDSRYFYFHKLDYEVKLALFTLATEYAATPLDERGQEKRYQIIKFGRNGTKVVLEKWSTESESESYWNAFGEIAWVTTDLAKAEALSLLTGGEVEEI